MVTVFLSTDWIYSFCPMVLGLMGRPLAEMHSTSPVSSAIWLSFPARTRLMT